MNWSHIATHPVISVVHVGAFVFKNELTPC